MERPSLELAHEIEKKYLSIDKIRVKTENLFKQGRISLRDIHILYEALFLKTQVEFENFIEGLFIGLLINGKGYKSSRKSISPRIQVNSHKVAREVIYGVRKKYIDWLPYDRTLGLSELFFKNGKPFNELDRSDLDFINKSHIIRNVVAHQSKSSMERFMKEVIGTTPIPQDEKQPATYLRGVFRTTPTPQTRFELHIASLKRISFKLAK